MSDHEFKLDPDSEDEGPLITSEHACDADCKSFHLSFLSDDGMEVEQIIDLLRQYANGLENGSIDLHGLDEEMHH